jgi:hypothetical protein
LKIFSALFPKLEDIFTAVNITLFSYNSIIFRTETLTGIGLRRFRTVKNPTMAISATTAMKATSTVI